MIEYSKLTDDHLVHLFVEGQNKAFDALLERYDALVHNYIRFTISDPYMADDIFQDAFIKAITTIKKGRYSAEGKFKSWILRITHNLMMDHFRREKSEAKWQGIADDDPDPILCLQAEELNGEELMVRNDELNDLYKYMTQLPIDQREVLMLRYWQELSFKDIADATGVSINTALGRMRYALINLRRYNKQ